jgi:hypothetical protein
MIFGDIDNNFAYHLFQVVSDKNESVESIEFDYTNDDVIVRYKDRCASRINVAGSDIDVLPKVWKGVFG